MQRTLIRGAFAVCLLVSVLLGIALLVGMLAAVRDGRGPNRLIVPLRLSQPADAQVFFDRGSGIRAEDCATSRAPGGSAAADVAFGLPRVPIRELRLDPMPFAGTFEVGAPRLESASGRVIARFPLSAVVARHQIAELRRQGATWKGTTVAEANDPQLTLELGAPLRVGKPRIPWPEAVALGLVASAAIALRRHPANRGWRWRSAAWSGTNVRTWLVTAPRSAVFAGIVLVLAIQAMRLWPLHDTLDWPLWDEANYAGAGARWADEGGTLASLHDSPLYTLTYGLLVQAGGVAAAVFAQHYLIKLAVVALLYVLLIRWTNSWIAAAALALWWGAAQFHLEFPLLVYQSAWAWFLLALVAFDRWPLAGLALLAAATATRQEYQFALLGALVWLGWRTYAMRAGWSAWIARAGSRRVGIAVSLSLLALAAYVAFHTRYSSAGHRAWFAFQQHYAVRAEATGEAAGINPWLDYAAVVQRDFGAANSLRSAWASNPSAFRRHVAYNFRHLGTELVALVRSHPHAAAAVWWLLAGIVALVARRMHAPTESRPPDCLLIAATGILVVAPGLLVLAKGAYLLPVVSALLGWLVYAVLRVSWPRRALAVFGGAAGALVLVALVVELRSPAVFQRGERPRPVAETVHALEAVWPEAGRHKLLGVAASSYAHYLGGQRCDGVEPIAAVSGRSGAQFSLAEALNDPQVHAVLVSEDWRRSPAFNPSLLEAALQLPRWQRRELGSNTIYWRDAAR